MLDAVNAKYFRMVVPELKKNTADELSGCCPVCGDNKDRLHLYWTEVGDLVHCFNSGCALSDKHHSMKNFLDIAAPQYYEQYKRETYKGVINELRNEKSLQDIINEAKNPVVSAAPEKDLPLDKLFKKARDIPKAVEYLANRSIEVQDDWYFSDQKFFEFDGNMTYIQDYLIIPVYNKEKKYRGFYSRSLVEKKFGTFLLPDTEKIWIDKPDQLPDIICEGIFDAISSGFDNPAAMLGAGLSKDYIGTLPKHTIIATDNDQTGIKKAGEFLNLGFKVFVWPEIKEKDFNEMLQIGYSKEGIRKFILSNTYQGIMGKVKLGIKEK